MPHDSVAIKPGVLFARTDVGGVLMDIAADRFVALSPTSAWIWGRIAAGAAFDGLVEEFAAHSGRRRESEAALVRRQFALWMGLGLINPAGPGRLALSPKPFAPPATRSITGAHEPRVRASGRSVVACLLAERQYRMLIRTKGLACALEKLQTERGELTNDADARLSSIVKSYHVVRQAFRQGHTARDCLFRSLGLAAVLRRRGIPADLCIGVTDLPFFSHAWVESGPFLLNEIASELQKYVVIGRF